MAIKWRKNGGKWIKMATKCDKNWVKMATKWGQNGDKWNKMAKKQQQNGDKMR